MIKRFISKYKAEGLNKEDFDIARKSIYGDVISSLNSVSSIANAILDYHFNDNEMFKYIEAVENTSLEDVNAKFQKMLDVNNCTLSVVKSPDGEV